MLATLVLLWHVVSNLLAVYRMQRVGIDPVLMAHIMELFTPSGKITAERCLRKKRAPAEQGALQQRLTAVLSEVAALGGITVRTSRHTRPPPLARLARKLCRCLAPSKPGKSPAAIKDEIRTRVEHDGDAAADEILSLFCGAVFKSDVLPSLRTWLLAQPHARVNEIFVPVARELSKAYPAAASGSITRVGGGLTRLLPRKSPAEASIPLDSEAARSLLTLLYGTFMARPVPGPRIKLALLTAVHRAYLESDDKDIELTEIEVEMRAEAVMEHQQHDHDAHPPLPPPPPPPTND